MGNEQTQIVPIAIATSPGAEIARLISAILERKPHPASLILNTLETEVEASARRTARLEVKQIVDEIRSTRIKPLAPVSEDADVPATGVIDVAAEVDKIVSSPPVPSNNPFAPRALPKTPQRSSWIEDAMTARAASDAKTTWDRMATFTAPLPRQPETLANVSQPQVEDLPDSGAVSDISKPIATVQALPEKEVDEEAFEADPAPYEARTLQGTRDAHDDRKNGWFGHNPDGLPLWLTAGVPVAAVSIFALGFMLRGGAGQFVTPALVQTSADSTVDLVAALPMPLEAKRETAKVSADLAVKDSPPVAGRPAKALPVLASASVAQHNVPSVDLVNNDIKPDTSGQTPIVASLIPAPSLKPVASVRSVTAAPGSPVRSVPQTVLKLPRQRVPVRLFTGSMEVGSAAAFVTSIAQQSGPALNESEQLWLARDMERVLDNEIDGRSVSLKSRQGQRVRVTLQSSQQVQREFSFARASEIAALPHNMVIEGGWYAARKDVSLHAAPALNTGLSHRILKRDGLIERLATYTDRYGDRWYLMGQRGMAVGFVSAADVVLAETHTRDLGLPYGASQGKRVNEIRTVYTHCREALIGPEGGIVQAMKVCRNPNGNWVAHHEGTISTREASLAGPLMPKAGTASAIILAEASGDPVAYHAFGNRRFRRRIQADLATAHPGQTTEQVLPNGDLIRFTFGERYSSEGLIPLIKVAALGDAPSRLQVSAGWKKAPIGARLRPTPDFLSNGDLGEIPAGRAVETLGEVIGIRDDKWVLVGRSGVGFGYVPADKLVPIDGRVSPYAISNTHGMTIAVLTDAVSKCRSVEYEMLKGTGRFEACQQVNASWAIKAASDSHSYFAQADLNVQTAP